MSAKLKLILPFLIIAALLAGYSFTQNQPPRHVDSITLKVTKDATGTWKVIAVSESIDDTVHQLPAQAKVKVNVNTWIYWVVDKTTDAYFQFPDSIFNTHAAGSSRLSDGYTIHIEKGGTLKLKIKNDKNVVGKTYVYSVFCMKDSVYAWGDSPPQIIVN